MKKKITFYMDAEVDRLFTLTLYAIHAQTGIKAGKSEIIEMLIKRFVEVRGEEFGKEEAQRMDV